MDTNYYLLVLLQAHFLYVQCNHTVNLINNAISSAQIPSNYSLTSLHGQCYSVEKWTWERCVGVSLERKDNEAQQNTFKCSNG